MKEIRLGLMTREDAVTRTGANNKNQKDKTRSTGVLVGSKRPMRHKRRVSNTGDGFRRFLGDEGETRDTCMAENENDEGIAEGRRITERDDGKSRPRGMAREEDTESTRVSGLLLATCGT
jgi:hypothetical protein